MLKYYIYFEKCGPQIWLCLLMFRPIAMKQLKSMTLINLFKSLDGSGLTHQIAVREVPVSIPNSGNDFYVCSLFCCCCVFTFLYKTHYFSCNACNPFGIIIHLVYFIHCYRFDRV